MIKGFIFDLDGVIVSTDECHYRAWKRLADEQGIPFDRSVNTLLRGVSRMEALDILLLHAPRLYSSREKEELAARKNGYYLDLIKTVTLADRLPGVTNFLRQTRKSGILCAIGSSSKNTRIILERIGLGTFFDAVVDGTMIRRSKPDPEVFVLAARLLGLPPASCAVFEDAPAGIQAANAAGMTSIGIGPAVSSDLSDLHAEALNQLSPLQIVSASDQPRRPDKTI